MSEVEEWEWRGFRRVTANVDSASADIKQDELGSTRSQLGQRRAYASSRLGPNSCPRKRRRSLPLALPEAMALHGGGCGGYVVLPRSGFSEREWVYVQGLSSSGNSCAPSKICPEGSAETSGVEVRRERQPTTRGEIYEGEDDYAEAYYNDGLQVAMHVDEEYIVSVAPLAPLAPVAPVAPETTDVPVAVTVRESHAELSESSESSASSDLHEPKMHRGFVGGDEASGAFASEASRSERCFDAWVDEEDAATNKDAEIAKTSTRRRVAPIDLLERRVVAGAGATETSSRSSRRAEEKDDPTDCNVPKREKDPEDMRWGVLKKCYPPALGRKASSRDGAQTWEERWPFRRADEEPDGRPATHVSNAMEWVPSENGCCGNGCVRGEIINPTEVNDGAAYKRCAPPLRLGVSSGGGGGCVLV